MKYRSPFLAAVLALTLAMPAHALTVNNLRVQSLRNPSPIDTQTPNFSWQLQSDERGVWQTSYRIVITSDPEGDDIVWDSGIVERETSVNVPATGASLLPAQRYYWTVAVRDNKGHEAQSTETAWFDTGLLADGWSGAMWIKASDLKAGETDDEMADYTVEGKVRIERTAAGLCFAGQGNDNFYFWQLNTEGDYPRLRPHVWTNGSPACLDNINLTGKVELNNTDEFLLRIEVTGASRAPS